VFVLRVDRLPYASPTVSDLASSNERVTVVVPTRDRPDPLRDCLEALDRQTFDDFAVVVVDDGSREERDVADAVASMRRRATLIRTERRGPAAARNAGAAAAASGLVCFTDDDCVPHVDWVSRLVESFRSGAAVVFGSVENARPDDPFAGAWHAIVDYLRSAGGTFAPSNNVACRVEIVQAIPFDEAYAGAAGEDRDWCARVSAAALPVVAEPRARVVHRQTLGFRGFWRQHFRYGLAAYAFRSRRGGIAGPSFYARLVAFGFKRGFRTGLLVAVAQLATAAGYAAARARGR
jgi:glycosyltransferase involved in cell wall biosynthesis